MENSFGRIRSAVIEGIAQTPRYIQRQLISLHDALIKASPSIRTAIQNDTNYTSGEIEAEIFLSLEALKQEYENFDIQKVLQAEYSLAHSKDHSSRRVAVGIIYLIPCEHNRFYSIIQPLAAAIAAGNCIMLEFVETRSEIDLLLRRIFSECLDQATILIVTGKPNDQDFFNQHCTVVDARLSPEVRGSARTLHAHPARTVAIVDRTISQADISLAAREIVRARFSFDGKSPYAPDLVLVNEFILQQFCREAAQFATISFANAVPSHLEGDENAIASVRPRRKDYPSNNALQQATQVSTLVSGSRGAVLLVAKRDRSLLDRKITEPLLVIHATTSLDDGITLVNSINNGKTHAATYFFANAVTAKYLSQFIPSRISFINSIPVGLLVGPSAPSSSEHATIVQPRLPRQLFSNPAPQFISQSEYHPLLTGLLDSCSKESRSQAQELISKPLKPPNQGSGFAIGFFEQGLLLGGAVGLATVIGSITALVWYSGPVLLRTLKRK